MSTIQASNVSDGTTTLNTSYVVNGSAKGWVNFNGSGTVAVRDSFNTSSITDGGTGAYSNNFTNSLANANYSVGQIGGYQNGSAAFSIVTLNHHSSAAPTSSQFNVLTDSGVSWGPSDLDYVMLNTNGDLA